MLRNPFFTAPIFALLAAGDALACAALARAPLPWPLAFLTWNGSPDAAWVLHGGVAIAAGILGGLSLHAGSVLTRLTLALFCTVIAAAMPVFGVMVIAALAFILRRPSTGGLRPEERFVFGNPEAVAAKRESRGSRPVLTPFAENFRFMDEDTLCQAILGLKHLGPAASIAPFLRRFQQDPRTSVQFTAQAVLSGTTETLEETVRELRARLAATPDDPETLLALAGTLDQLADWTPPGDTTAAIYRRDAFAVLTKLESHHALQNRVLPLLARLQLAAGDPQSSLQTTARWVDQSGPSDEAAHAALLESLFQQSRWDDLSAAARQSAPQPGKAESLAFWTQPAA